MLDDLGKELDAQASTSKLASLVNSGEISGYEDSRLITAFTDALGDFWPRAMKKLDPTPKETKWYHLGGGGKSAHVLLAEKCGILRRS